ncbi:aspartate--tRNA ligase 2, cytoplasmic-like [Hordeum vulgare subsp. vulgare]|uniref:aspartate--tRNA ligase n=1 Tax=Hordeum vulgare subsp. vulgare TaxID=112509 RepID=A0A8I6YRN5_HORVV|nr:aspartate--tRNA ligase 2, cytoplasmic-like [Hordeum vulgare subsp. vulgare]
MSPPPASTEELEQELSAATISKKQLKKDARKAEKARKASEQQQQPPPPPQEEEDDPFAANYGDEEIQSKAISGRSWTDIGDVDETAAGHSVLIRGFAQTIRPVSKKMGFVVLRQRRSTVQCLLVASADAGVSAQMVRFAASLTKESIVDVEGIVTPLKEPRKDLTQLVEIRVSKIYCINRAIPTLPLNFEDAARTKAEFEAAEQKGVPMVHVHQDTRLNYRPIDIRTPANLSIFTIEHHVESKFKEFLFSKNFIGIHTPKLIGGSSEGGASVFKLDYNGQPACLAQSPQLYKQMAICGGFGRVFEVGSVFRAEKSNTHRHLCEFIGLDAEMEIKEHYFEVCDIIDGLFVAIFDHLNEHCKEELEEINRKNPFEPLTYLAQTLKLTYEQGIQMLKEAGTEIEPMGDLNTEAEKKLGRLVKEMYGTDFFILYRYPLAVRPFYTMPCYDDPAYSNSFDVFIRGEEIISGAQRIHTPKLLRERAIECGIDTSTIRSYIESFSYGAPPHGGFGVGLERVVMLFCGLNNVRKTSLFPRDPQRLTP